MSAPIDNIRNPPVPAPAPAPTVDAAGLPVGYVMKPGWEVSPREIHEAMKAGRGPLLIDCRRPEEWAFNRITGATHVPMSEVESRIDEIESDGGARTRAIVVYCHHGVRSLRVAAALRAHGFTDVRSMAGGIDLWSVAVDAGVPRY